MLRRAISSLLLCCLLYLHPVAIAASPVSFTLAGYQGVILATGQVLDSKDQDCDLTVSPRYRGHVAYATLRAERLAEFSEKPDVAKITKQTVSQYKNLIFAPASGYYYVAQAKDGRCYVLSLDKFENQGKPLSHWKLIFNATEFQPR